MKITSFYPLIASKHQEELIDTFKAFGFDMAHFKSDFDVIQSSNTIMKDNLEHRFELSDLGDLVNSDNKDVVMIRVNVDDLEEYTKLLKDKGFSVAVNDETKSAKYCMMISKSGLVLDLCEHLK